MSIINQRLALFLASMRVLQHAMENNGPVDHDILTDGDQYPVPHPEDIEDVCEDLNCQTDEVAIVIRSHHYEMRRTWLRETEGAFREYCHWRGNGAAHEYAILKTKKKRPGGNLSYQERVGELAFSLFQHAYNLTGCTYQQALLRALHEAEQ